MSSDMTNRYSFVECELQYKCVNSVYVYDMTSTYSVNYVSCMSMALTYSYSYSYSVYFLYINVKFNDQYSVILYDQYNYSVYVYDMTSTYSVNYSNSVNNSVNRYDENTQYYSYSYSVHCALCMSSDMTSTCNCLLYDQYNYSCHVAWSYSVHSRIICRLLQTGSGNLP
ncbi:hypothetical protein DPMN_161407 [Dreissena polymorpha]|uniref:Uncharacterized protein n=1 Tax=Dreissena polymorpha TaxID=45954 RepID=A0A9D4ISK8_DREPO|nr:hypothetical protein DPMN_161407 [Dreissena polymorpha]